MTRILSEEERIEYNTKILDKLSNFIYANPEIRFCQALAILKINEFISDPKTQEVSIKDNFNEEPNITCKRLIQALKSN